MNCFQEVPYDCVAGICCTCGPVTAFTGDAGGIGIPSVDCARHVGKVFVKACRALGEDVQLDVGYDAVAAGLGSTDWSQLVRHGDPAASDWSDDRCRDGVLAALPDIDPTVLEGALDHIHFIFGERA